MPARPGVKHHKAKLTEAQVLEIRAKYEAGGTSYWKLALEYDIESAHTIGAIITRKAWKHL